MKDNVLFKGGGYGGHSFGAGGIRLRHHYWTGTTDLPNPSPGVPPLDGGLEKPPNCWKRFIAWIKWIAHGGK